MIEGKAYATGKTIFEAMLHSILNRIMEQIIEIVLNEQKILNLNALAILLATSMQFQVIVADIVNRTKNFRQ